MNNQNKSIFSNKTISTSNKKKRNILEDDAGDQNYKAKQAKIISDSKPVFPVSETNAKRFQISEDGDHTSIKEQNSQTKTKEKSEEMMELNTVAYRFEEEIAEQVENTISDLEKSLHNDVTTQFPWNQSYTAVNSTTESSGEDVQWEIIRVPNSTENLRTNGLNSKNIPVTVQDKTDDSIIPGQNSRKHNVSCWLENCSFVTENRQQNFIQYDEFQSTTKKSLTEDKMDDNKLEDQSIANDTTFPNSCFTKENPLQNENPYKEFLIPSKSFTKNKLGDKKLKADSITRDETSDSSKQRDNSYLTAESITQPFAFPCPSPERVSNAFRILNPAVILKANVNSDVFHNQRGEFEIKPQHHLSASLIQFDENMDSEEMDINSVESLSIFEETEEDDFHTTPSTLEVSEKNSSEKMFHNNSNHLHDNATRTNGIEGTKATNNQSSINNEEMTKEFNSSFENSNLKSSGQSNNGIVSESATTNYQVSIYNKEMAKRGSSFFTNSKSKSCGHSINDINSVVIKRIRKSKLKLETPKYTVVNGTNHKKGTNKLRPKTDLQNFIKNCMTRTHPELFVNDNIEKRLEIFLVDILQRIGDEAGSLVTLSSKKMFDKRVLKYAIKLALEKMKNEADVVSGERNQWLF